MTSESKIFFHNFIPLETPKDPPVVRRQGNVGDRGVESPRYVKDQIAGPWSLVMEAPQQFKVRGMHQQNLSASHADRFFGELERILQSFVLLHLTCALP